jgi:hypothetical protein
LRPEPAISPSQQKYMYFWLVLVSAPTTCCINQQSPIFNNFIVIAWVMIFLTFIPVLLDN